MLFFLKLTSYTELGDKRDSNVIALRNAILKNLKCGFTC